jgi:hypothetical protein
VNEFGMPTMEITPAMLAKLDAFRAVGGIEVQTQKFTLTIGVRSGYSCDGPWPDSHEADGLLRTWARLVRAELAATGVYVPAYISNAEVVYYHPPGDLSFDFVTERILVVTGTRNPAKSPDKDAWLDAVRRLAVAFRAELKQETAQFDVCDVTMTYLTRENT